METEYSKSEIEELLKSDDAGVVTEALMYLCFNINDPEWVQDKCIELAESDKDMNVRKLSLTCIGHVARIYSKINKSKVVPVLEKYLRDPALSGRAQDALDDIEIFVK